MDGRTGDPPWYQRLNPISGLQRPRHLRLVTELRLQSTGAADCRYGYGGGRRFSGGGHNREDWCGDASVDVILDTSADFSWRAVKAQLVDELVRYRGQHGLRPAMPPHRIQLFASTQPAVEFPVYRHIQVGRDSPSLGRTQCTAVRSRLGTTKSRATMSACGLASNT